MFVTIEEKWLRKRHLVNLVKTWRGAKQSATSTEYPSCYSSQRNQKEYEKSLKIVKKGVLGKYQKKREAEIKGFENALKILKELGDGNDSTVEGKK